MIYYLDDEVSLLTIVKEYFENKSLDIEVFQQASDLLCRIKEQPADLLILDYRLDETTGTQVSEYFPGIPKIIVTGELDFQKPTNIDEILKKPFLLKDLYDLTEELLS